MDASLLIADAFWADPSPLAMLVPGMAAPDLNGVPGHVFFQTSGSTAAPKWIGLSRAALMSSAKVVNDHLEVTADSCWGLLLPLHHVGGFGVVARAHQAGCRMVTWSGKWSAADVVAWLDRERVTHTSLVPTQVHDLVAARLQAPASLRAVVVGGGCLDERLGKQARELGWPVLASYGMTEAGSQIATQPLDALDHEYRPAPIPVLPHWQVAVDDDGLLRIAGDALCAGALVQSEGAWIYQPREDQWLCTSDRVDLCDGMLTPLGRADLQVKVLGELVDLAAIERELVVLSVGAIPADSLVVLALSDARAENVLIPVLDILLDRNLVGDVLRRYAEQAPGYARLGDPVFLESFPRSELSKPLRYECARRVS